MAGEPVAAPAASACIGIDVRVRDLGKVREHASRAGTALSERPDGIAVIDYLDFGNVLLRFVD